MDDNDEVNRANADRRGRDRRTAKAKSYTGPERRQSNRRKGERRTEPRS